MTWPVQRPMSMRSPVPRGTWSNRDEHLSAAWQASCKTLIQPTNPFVYPRSVQATRGSLPGCFVGGITHHYDLDRIGSGDVFYSAQTSQLGRRKFEAPSKNRPCRLVTVHSFNSVVIRHSEMD